MINKLRNILIVGIACMPFALFAASFDGNARVEINDPDGKLSWPSEKELTVYCWFKISIPSDKTVSQNMTILVDGKASSDSNKYAYLIQYNYESGNIEFRTKGTLGFKKITLIEKPYLDRWYHVAIVRIEENYKCYVDGISFQAEKIDVGDSYNTNGVI